MPDHARSDDPAVQRALDRLAALSPGADTLGLERIGALLDRLDRPQDRLPPVFHVAGTNGKGSTCAFLRAALEAAGHRVHVFTSPHLVRFNERIRLAGRLIDDAGLAAGLARVLDVADGIGPSFFEATTAAALLAFADTPADACVIEVGLGGRLDATNVVARPVSTGIARLALDHQAFLGDRLETIAAEKAGIARAGVPLVTQVYDATVAERVAAVAATAGATWLPRGAAWDVAADDAALRYHDGRGALTLPQPRLAGPHQADNAGLAIAMLRHQAALAVPDAALAVAMGGADWPARMQRLGPGPLRALLPDGAALWLDGGHNPDAARAVSAHLRDAAAGRSLHLVVGLLANKDAAGVFDALAGCRATVHAVPVAAHACHAPETLAERARAAGLSARPARDVADALARIGRDAAPGEPPFVLVMGSLYLAGAVLAANGEPPA